MNRLQTIWNSAGTAQILPHHSCSARTVQPFLENYSHGQPVISKSHSSWDHNKPTQAKPIPAVHLMLIPARISPSSLVLFPTPAPSGQSTPNQRSLQEKTPSTNQAEAERPQGFGQLLPQGYCSKYQADCFFAATVICTEPE